MPRPHDPAEGDSSTAGDDGSAVRASAPGRTAAGPPRWLGNLALWVGGALALVVLVLLAVAVLPGWWAELVGGWVLGVQSRGVWLGLLLGALFTILPIGVALLAMRRPLTPGARLALVVIALLLLLPNVLTIAIAAGRSDARHVLAIQAPGLVGATVAAIVVVVVLAVAVIGIRTRSRRTRRKLDEARVRAIEVGRERAAEARAAEVQAESGADPDEGSPAGPRERSEPTAAGPEEPPTAGVRDPQEPSSGNGRDRTP